MNRYLLLGFGALVAASFCAGGYVLLVPKVGHATRAEIDAALPASLKVADPPDPAGEARYARLAALVGGFKSGELSAAQGNPTKPADRAALARVIAGLAPTLGEVEQLLKEGPLRYPERKPDTLFKDSPKLKDFSKALALATADAAARGDRAACARLAALNLRYAHALADGGGVLIDGLVAVASEAIAARAAYEAEMAGGLDAAGREAVLAQLPLRKGPLPAMAGWLRRDFQAMSLPYLLEPKKLTGGMFEANPDGDESRPKETMPGTFDPVATARLMGRIYDAGIADAARPVYAQTDEASKLAEKAGEGLPQNPNADGMEGLVVRFRMNAGRNTLGRYLATNTAFFGNLAGVSARRGADDNLLRAVLLLRMGRPADLPDPYGKGKLRVDRKRRIVWSVGENGKDDGGSIGAKYTDKAADMGRRY